MITVITSFQLPELLTREKARSLFLKAAPKYQGMVGAFAQIPCPVGRRKGGRRLPLERSSASRDDVYGRLESIGI